MLHRWITPNFFLILLLGISLFASGIAEANKPPEIAQTIEDRGVQVSQSYGEVHLIIGIFVYFKDPDGDTLTYTASSADTNIATASYAHSVVTITMLSEGTVTITVTATDPGGLSVDQSFSLTIYPPNRAPTSVPIPDQSVTVNATTQGDLDLVFSDPDGDTLTYTASSEDTSIATVSVSGSIFTITGVAVGRTGIDVTATDAKGNSDGRRFFVTVDPLPDIAGSVSDDVGTPVDPLAGGTGGVGLAADAVPGLSSQELAQLGALLTYDTLIFNELHNGSDDTTDWLELHNVSGTDLSLDDWQLTIRAGGGSVVIPFPAGTVLPAGEVLLLTNTEMAGVDASVSSVVAEAFALPQSDFAVVLRSPTAFGDLAGNYFQTEGERPETAPALTLDTVWYRTQPINSGYRTEAWAESTYQDGLGTPGSRHPSSVADLNNDGVINILDLVLVASQFGMTDTMAADLNGDNTVNIQDLVIVANALGDIAGAPAAQRSTAGLVNDWLRLARQNASSVVEPSLPEGFSYERGIHTLEQLARALIPERTALLANYPNPFNPETWIPYQLAKAAEVTVSIYAADGRLVRMLALGHQDAGMYKNRSQAAYWDGKNDLGETVASGIYFYTLSTESTRDSVTAGEFTATRKMLILK